MWTTGARVQGSGFRFSGTLGNETASIPQGMCIPQLTVVQSAS